MYVALCKLVVPFQCACWFSYRCKECARWNAYIHMYRLVLYIISWCAHDKAYYHGKYFWYLADRQQNLTFMLLQCYFQRRFC